MSRTIEIPQNLDDKDAVISVLRQLNLLKTGQTIFGSKEISAALHWARVPADQHFRFKTAMERHGLFWKVAPAVRRRLNAVPLRNSTRTKPV